MTSAGMTALGCIILYLSSSLCSSAGVGGGTLNVPILMNIFGFSYSTATILSLCTLMGNYLFQTLINLDKRHPTSPTKPLIYWDAVMILLPSELGGSNVGVIIEQIMPDTYLYIIALIVLIIAGAMTLNKAIHLYDEENHALMDQHENVPLLRENPSSSYNTGASDTDIKARVNLGAFGDTEDQPVVVMPPKPQGSVSDVFFSIIPPYLYCYSHCCKEGGGRTVSDMDDETEKIPISQPWIVIRVIIIVWSLYAICYVVMHEFDTCSVGYYVVLGIIYPLLIIEVFWGVNYLRFHQKADPTSIAEGDIDWTGVSYLLAFFAFIIGILTSLLGIGGGELMGPMMLIMKVLPIVSSATTSVMSLLNSSSSILHYIVLGDVPYGYAGLTFGIGAAGGLTGRLLGLFVAKYYGRTSFLVFALVAVLTVSFGVYIAYIFTEDVDVTFGTLCS